VVGIDAVPAVHHVRRGHGDLVGGSQQVSCERELTPLVGQAGEGVRGVDLDLRIADAATLLEDVEELLRALTSAVLGVDRGQQASGEQRPLTPSGRLVPAVVLFEKASCCVGLAGGPPQPSKVQSRGGGEPQVTAVGGGQDRAVQREDRGVGISGALLNTAERCEMQGGLADEAEKLGLGGRPRKMLGRVPNRCSAWAMAPSMASA